MNRYARLISDCFMYPLNAVNTGETFVRGNRAQRDAKVDGHSKQELLLDVLLGLQLRENVRSKWNLFRDSSRKETECFVSSVLESY